MSNFAKLLNNVVIAVVAVNNDILLDENGIEQEQKGIDFLKSIYKEPLSEWKQTSYNTRGGVHYDPETREPSEDQSKALRYNYAGIGFTFDPDKGTDGAFIPPKPFESWVLNEDTCLWEAPVAYPEDGEDYTWDEELQEWTAVENETE